MLFILCFLTFSSPPPFFAAELPTSEISTKRIKLAEDGGEKEKEAGEGGQTVVEEKTWPEPLRRVAPPVRSALVLPEGAACPEGCKRFSWDHPDPLVTNKLRCGAEQLSCPVISSLEHISNQCFFLQKGRISSKVQMMMLLSQPSPVLSPS